MSSEIKISDELLGRARVRAKTFHRFTAGQIEYWAKIGQLLEENPELPYSFVEDSLLGIEEFKAGHTESYVFGEGGNL